VCLSSEIPQYSRFSPSISGPQCSVCGSPNVLTPGLPLHSGLPEITLWVPPQYRSPFVDEGSGLGPMAGGEVCQVL
jgi:hypothetical protein